jgi:hypothetical protein
MNADSSLYYNSEFRLQELLVSFNQSQIDINELATTIEIRQGELEHKVKEELAAVELTRDKAKGDIITIIIIIIIIIITINIALLNRAKVRHSSLLESLRNLQAIIQNEKNFKSIHFLEFSSAEGKLNENAKIKQQIIREHTKALQDLSTKALENRKMFKTRIEGWNS